MFVVTADQKGSRSSADLVPAALAAIGRLDTASRVLLGPERTVGDELQLVTADARATLDVVLLLARERRWSVGVGAGAVEEPLSDSVRASRGVAFVRAREAVDRAKRSTTRVAIESAGDVPRVEPLIGLLVDLRDRRSPKGWEVDDLLAAGLSQREAAERLGITESAVSLRAKTAGVHLERDAREALVPLLDAVGRGA
jgi:hypothetical protein